MTSTLALWRRSLGQRPLGARTAHESRCRASSQSSRVLAAPGRSSGARPCLSSRVAWLWRASWSLIPWNPVRRASFLHAALTESGSIGEPSTREKMRSLPASGGWPRRPRCESTCSQWSRSTKAVEGGSATMRLPFVVFGTLNTFLFPRRRLRLRLTDSWQRSRSTRLCDQLLKLRGPPRRPPGAARP